MQLLPPCNHIYLSSQGVEGGDDGGIWEEWFGQILEGCFGQIWEECCGQIWEGCFGRMSLLRGVFTRSRGICGASRESLHSKRSSARCHDGALSESVKITTCFSLGRRNQIVSASQRQSIATQGRVTDILEYTQAGSLPKLHTWFGSPSVPPSQQLFQQSHTRLTSINQVVSVYSFNQQSCFI